MKYPLGFFNPSTVQFLNYLVYLLLVFLPLLGGGNYFFSLSPLWGQFILIISISVLLLLYAMGALHLENIISLSTPDIGFLVFISLFLVSALFSVNKPESLMALLPFLGSVSLSILIRLAFGTISSIDKTAMVILISSVPVVLYEFYQSVWQFGSIVNEVAQDQHYSLIREHFKIHRSPFSTFMTSNNLASYLAMIIPINLYFILKESRKKKWIFMFCLVSTGIFLSQSKGGVIIYFIVFLLWLLFAFSICKNNIVQTLVKVIPAMFIAGIMTIIIGNIEWKPEGEKSFNQTISTYLISGGKIEISASARLKYWETAVNIWKDHWLAGSGPGTFATVSPQYQESAFYSRHAHNEILEMLAETGLLGLSAFLSFMVMVFIYGMRALLHLKKESQILIEKYEARKIILLIGSMMIGLTGFLLHSLIDFNWEIMANRTMAQVVAMMIVALSGMVSEAVRGLKENNMFKLRVARPAIIGVALVLIVIQGVWLPKVSIAESYFSLAQNPFETDLSKRIEFAESALENFPSQSRYLLFLASAYQQRSEATGNAADMERAIHEGENALKLAPFIAETHARQGDLLSAQGNYGEAEEEMLVAIKMEKMNLGFYNQLGLFYAKNKKYDKAREILEKGIKLEEAYIRANHPEQVEVARAYIILGGVLEELHLPEEALKRYLMAIKFYDGNPSLKGSGNWNVLRSGLFVHMISYAHARSAFIYQSLGKQNDAEKEFQLSRVTEYLTWKLK